MTQIIPYTPQAPRQSSLDGRIRWEERFGNFALGTLAMVVSPPANGGQVGDIQRAIDKVSREGGGTVYLTNGVYSETDDITLKSSVALVGEKESTTIVNFGDLPLSIKYEDSSVYTTGTITSITSGVMVTGSGTSWLANLTTSHQINIGNRWYGIAAVTSDTTLILSEGYINNATLPVSYRASIIATDINISELSVVASASGAINLRGARNVILNDLTLASNSGGGIVWDYVSENVINQCVVSSNTSDGVTMTNCSFGNINSLASVSNTGYGFVLDTLETMPFNFCAASSNSDGGVVGSSLTKCLLGFELGGNTGIGLELTDTCNNCYIQTTLASGNSSDGIKLTATCDRCIIQNNMISFNGGYGINIAAASCDKNLILGNQLQSNTSGTINDTGTGTVSANNVT